MGKSNAVPDAWEDDWETQADKIVSSSTAQTEAAQEAQEPPPRSKEDRLARHAESNRKLWESAESPETFHFLDATNNVPLTTSFKPQVKVLSRKPVIAKRDPATGMSRMTLDDGDDKDDRPPEPQPTPEEIRAQQRRNHEEKQRRYEEARAKIFGESAPSSGASSPVSGAATPPRSDGQHTPRGGGKGGRGRGSGGGGGGGGSQRMNNDARQADSRRQNGRELFEPSYAPRPADAHPRGTDGDSPGRSRTPRGEQQAVRAPRGPDGSGRGGFGFSRRGARGG